MQLGFVLPRPDVLAGARDLREFASAGQGLGFSFTRLLDHVVNGAPESYGDGDPYGPGDPFSEPITTASFLAGCCTLAISTGVVIAPQRQTVLLAKQAAEVQRFSCESLRLGLGLGWNRVEYRALGQPMQGRADRLTGQARLLKTLLSGAEVVVDEGAGMTRCRLLPAPAIQPEVWFGCGDAEPALRRVAELGDGWMPSPELSWDQIVAAWATIGRLAIEVGRDPAEIALDGRVDVPSPGHPGVDATISRWRDLGADYLTVKSIDPPDRGFRSVSTDAAHHLACMDTFMEAARSG